MKASPGNEGKQRAQTGRPCGAQAVNHGPDVGRDREGERVVMHTVFVPMATVTAPTNLVVHVTGS